MLCKQCSKIIESQKEGTSYFSVAEEKVQDWRCCMSLDFVIYYEGYQAVKRIAAL